MFAIPNQFSQMLADSQQDYEKSLSSLLNPLQGLPTSSNSSQFLEGSYSSDNSLSNLPNLDQDLLDKLSTLANSQSDSVASMARVADTVLKSVDSLKSIIANDVKTFQGDLANNTTSALTTAFATNFKDFSKTLSNEFQSIVNSDNLAQSFKTNLKQSVEPAKSLQLSETPTQTTQVIAVPVESVYNLGKTSLSSDFSQNFTNAYDNSNKSLSVTSPLQNVKPFQEPEKSIVEPSLQGVEKTEAEALKASEKASEKIKEANQSENESTKPSKKRSKRDLTDSDKEPSTNVKPKEEDSKKSLLDVFKNASIASSKGFGDILTQATGAKDVPIVRDVLQFSEKYLEKRSKEIEKTRLEGREQVTVKSQLSELYKKFSEFNKRNDKSVQSVENSVESVSNTVENSVVKAESTTENLSNTVESSVKAVETNTESLKNTLEETVKETDKALPTPAQKEDAQSLASGETPPEAEPPKKKSRKGKKTVASAVEAIATAPVNALETAYQTTTQNVEKELQGEETSRKIVEISENTKKVFDLLESGKVVVQVESSPFGAKETSQSGGILSTLGGALTEKFGGKLLGKIGLGGLAGLGVGASAIGAGSLLGGASSVASLATPATSTAVAQGSKAVASTAGKEVAEIGAKSAGKSLLKKIPLLGALFGLGFGASRLFEGDVTGAGLEVASGLAGALPVVGTGASLALDAGILARDISNAGESEQALPQPAQAMASPLDDINGLNALEPPNLNANAKGSTNVLPSDKSLENSVAKPLKPDSMLSAVKPEFQNGLSGVDKMTSVENSLQVIDRLKESENTLKDLRLIDKSATFAEVLKSNYDIEKAVAKKDAIETAKLTQPIVQPVIQQVNPQRSKAITGQANLGGMKAPLITRNPDTSIQRVTDSLIFSSYPVG